MAARLLLALAVACLAAGCQAHFVNFTLPMLPYLTTSFEPYIDNATMYLHWFKFVAAAAAATAMLLLPPLLLLLLNCNVAGNTAQSADGCC